jgi:hypothetical protein
MVGFSSPFSGENAEDSFDDYEEFVSEHIPTPVRSSRRPAHP